MGWYEVFGFTLASERTFGCSSTSASSPAIYALTRAWSHRVAVICAVTATLLVLTPIGLSALAWEGGSRSRCGRRVRRRGIHTSGATRRLRSRRGALAGLGAVVPSGPRRRARARVRVRAVAVRGSGRRRSLGRGRRLHADVDPPRRRRDRAVVAGHGDRSRRRAAPGRELPAPAELSTDRRRLQAVAEGPLDAPWWRVPGPRAHHQLFLWFFVVSSPGVGLARSPAPAPPRPPTRAGRARSPAPCSASGMLPQALQRPDSTHLAWGSCVSSALPALLVELVALWRAARMAPPGTARRAARGAPSSRSRCSSCAPSTRTARTSSTAASVSATGRRVRGAARASATSRSATPAAACEPGRDRHLDAHQRPGRAPARRPADLSRTIYSDVVFYHLFPELEPATYFIEMDPGLADEPGRVSPRRRVRRLGAAHQLLDRAGTSRTRRASSAATSRTRSSRPVLPRRRLRERAVLLYRACEQGDGVSPAGIGIGADRRASLERELAEPPPRVSGSGP
jgi:hypothetical protein